MKAVVMEGWFYMCHYINFFLNYFVLKMAQRSSAIQNCQTSCQWASDQSWSKMCRQQRVYPEKYNFKRFILGASSKAVPLAWISSSPSICWAGKSAWYQNTGRKKTWNGFKGHWQTEIQWGTKTPYVNFPIITIFDFVQLPLTLRSFESHSYLACVTAPPLRRP